jgi:TldD protein
MNKQVDPAFLALPYERLAEVALSEMRELKCSYGDFRFERLKGQMIQARDVNVERVTNSDSIGYGVRVIHEGSWGFASSYDLSERAVRDTAQRAVAVAKQLAKLNAEPVQQAPEPSHTGTHVSSYKINPFEVSDEEKIAYLLKVNQTVLDSKKAQHVEFALNQVLENKFFASTEGTKTTQQRVRLHGNFDAVRVDPATGAFETMRSLGVPVGQGWEYLIEGYDYMKAARETPELLEQKMASKSVDPGRYDIVLDPTNMWLTIHESIGHATEFDRVLGYEANYAGTSFATLDKLNSLQYGSKVMHVTADRTVEHGLSTVGWDDEGVEGQQWDLIKDGVLVGYQLNRQMAMKLGLKRSNGCAFADSPSHVPIQRMANVSLQPGKEDISTDDLISKVDRGIYIMGDKSWSIDMQRYNFQFTGQRLFEIRNGRIVGQLKDVAYQGVTTEFWNSMEAVGGPETYLLGGAFNCGKGQPGQVAPVSHGAPVALFRNINILNTTKEGAK